MTDLTDYKPKDAATIEAFKDDEGRMHTTAGQALTSNYRRDVSIAAQRTSQGMKEFDGIDLELQALFARRFVIQNKAMVRYMLENDI